METKVNPRCGCRIDNKVSKKKKVWRNSEADVEDMPKVKKNVVRTG